MTSFYLMDEEEGVQQAEGQHVQRHEGKRNWALQHSSAEPGLSVCEGKVVRTEMLCEEHHMLAFGFS